MTNKGTLVFFCGKMGAGKSTKSRQLASEMAAILISEDAWLAALYPEEIKSIDDYLTYSLRLKPLLKIHVQALLQSGVSVVMDFPANTLKQRAWFREIFSEQSLAHKLIYLDLSDSQCLSQIATRRAQQPERAAFDTEAVFHTISSYFQAPTEDEGFDLEVLCRANIQAGR
jgi:predicted kinase